MFYGDFYSNGGKSPAGRAFGRFLGDVLATPFRALEAKEFLTDPEYRHYVNPGGTSLKDYLGAVLNLGLELGVIKLEVLVVKAVCRALRPALKNLGEKIAEALKRGGMEPLVADNYARRFDEAVRDASDAKLNQAADDAVQAKGGSTTPGSGPRIPRPGRPFVHKSSGAANELSDLARRVTETPSLRETILLGRVNNRQVGKLDEILPGKSVQGYRRVIESTSVRHALTRHSDPAELLQGQVPLTVDDLDLYHLIVSKPDLIEYDGLSNLGNQVILYRKRINGSILIVEEVRRGRQQLAFKTMRKYKR